MTINARVRGSRFEISIYAVQGYEITKASKSFIKDERDLNQDYVG
jgi:hypothetical protein